jgi:hypothetical protein
VLNVRTSGIDQVTCCRNLAPVSCVDRKQPFTLQADDGNATTGEGCYGERKWHIDLPEHTPFAVKMLNSVIVEIRYPQGSVLCHSQIRRPMQISRSLTELAYSTHKGVALTYNDGMVDGA